MQNVRELESQAISIQNAAKSIDMSEMFVRRLVESDTVKSFKFGRSVRIVKESWEKYLKQRERK